MKNGDGFRKGRSLFIICMTNISNMGLLRDVDFKNPVRVGVRVRVCVGVRERVGVRVGVGVMVCVRGLGCVLGCVRGLRLGCVSVRLGLGEGFGLS